MSGLVTFRYRAGRERLEGFENFRDRKWPRPRPESGLDRLICSTFVNEGTPSSSVLHLLLLHHHLLLLLLRRLLLFMFVLFLLLLLLLRLRRLLLPLDP